MKYRTWGVDTTTVMKISTLYIIIKIILHTRWWGRTMYIPYPPENKPPSKRSPLHSLTLKFLHSWYVCLDYKPPSHQVDCTHTHTHARACMYVRNPALQLTTTTKSNLLYTSVMQGLFGASLS